MVNPPLDSLIGRSFPELGAATHERCAEILQQWEADVRKVLPSADELTFSQLRDSFPQILAVLADALSVANGKPIAELMAGSVEHGGTRFHQNYDLNEVLIEYHLLRRAMFDQVTSHMGRAPDMDEIHAMNAALDVTLRQAVLAFCQHQNRQLKAANEAQSKYLSFLSHDLRGGLNGIFLMIEVLRRELSGHTEMGETVQDLELMRRSLLETVATMDRFLHAERFRKGKVQVRPGPVNLNHLLNEVASHVGYQAKDKGIDVKINVPLESKLISDRELLSLIFQNLISNAVKYTDKGTVEISAAAAKTGWQVEVTDQGPAVAPEMINDLFDSFTRGDTHGKPGVGLGLNIAHQAAMLMGAQIWVESEKGKGSTFFVQVPEIKAK